MHERAGTVALPEDLTDIDALISAYYDIEPDPSNPDQRVSFGTSGHRGSAFDGKFNEAHIVAITQAIVDYRAEQGFNGPLFIGRDTHALSEPAWRTALEVLAANNVDVRIDARGSYTPTPAVSVAILGANGAPKHLRTTGEGLADGIVVTPSHNPPRDGGFKYNPPHGGPADSDATSWIAKRANEILEKGWRSVDRVLGSDLLDHPASTASTTWPTTLISLTRSSISMRFARPACASAPIRWAEHRWTTGARLPSATAWN